MNVHWDVFCRRCECTAHRIQGLFGLEMALLLLLLFAKQTRMQSREREFAKVHLPQLLSCLFRHIFFGLYVVSCSNNDAKWNRSAEQWLGSSLAYNSRSESAATAHNRWMQPISLEIGKSGRKREREPDREVERNAIYTCTTVGTSNVAIAPHTAQHGSHRQHNTQTHLAYFEMKIVGKYHYWLQAFLFLFHWHWLRVCISITFPLQIIWSNGLFLTFFFCRLFSFRRCVLFQRAFGLLRVLVLFFVEVFRWQRFHTFT